MEKLYDRIDWNNNTNPALNETNLNLMSKAVDDIDDRVIDLAADIMVTVPQIQEDLAEAEELLEDAEAITTHPPIIGQNGNWWTWDTSTDAYADSGVDAGVSVNVGTTTTLPAGSDATVTNSGTDTDPILNFGIPQGVAGQNGQDGADGQDGVSPEVTVTQITGGHTVTITDADHPAGQSFNVMDGVDGQDGQDGAPGVGVPSGGTTGQVLAKASGTDYDTEWVNASGGSGGHTIQDNDGISMTQRTGLQFEGMGVTDDGTNDRTKVKLPIFNGTTAQWTALSSTEKAKYQIVNLSDDYGCEWQYLGSTNGGSGLTIPSNFKELLIFGKVATKYTTVPYLLLKDAYEVIKTAVGSSSQYVMPLYLSWLMQKSDATPPMYGVYVNAYIDGNYKIYGQSAYEVSGSTLTSKSYELIVYYR
jgi:hypothetical protein